MLVNAVRTVRAGVLAAMVACAGLATATPPAPPTDADIDALIQKVNEAGKGDTDRAAQAKAKQEAAKAGLEGLSLGEATLKQLEKVIDARVGSFPMVRDAMKPRLEELSKGTGAEAARAAELALSMFQPKYKPQTRELTPESEGALADALLALFKHPGYAELIKSGKGEGAFRMLGNLPAKAMVEKHVLEAAEPHINDSLSMAGVFSLRSVLTAMVGSREPVTDVPSELRERVRMRIAAATAAAIEKNKGAEGPVAQQVKGLRDVLAMAEGPWAKGTLIGNPAPAIDFTWVSGEGKAKSFADFKGKVVMIDFWATWCGPCRAAFPKMHQLAERYKGKDVVILGLTSVQGFHIDGANKRIDCKDDPAKEMGLMPSLMKEMDVNWTIAFGDKSCFNPDFGVQGIPHVAIIDAKGVVRYNALYPNPVEESEKIDALLKEAGLSAPEKPMELEAPKPVQIKPAGAAPAPAPAAAPAATPKK